MKSRYAVAMALSCAAHLALAALLAGLPTRVPLPGGLRPDRTIEVFNATPPEDRTFAGLNPVDRSHDEWTRPQGTEPSSLRIGNLTIDVEKIRGRAAVLFPFLTPGLSLENFFPVQRSPRRSGLQNPLASAHRQDAKERRALTMSEAKLQALVDKSWSRRDRWAAFDPVARLADLHDADSGQLPALFQKYRDQNSLQPYAESGSRDPRLWVQLGIAADHVTFIAFIRRFASEHPSTRATTELLFLLDKLAEANADALDVLRDSDPPELLGWTRQTNRDAYRLINGIRGYYERELHRLGLTSDAAIDRHYDKVRLSILQGILRTTPQGYRANDARFLIGAIHWRQQNVERALESWREMTTADRDDSYVVAGSQIVAALRGLRMDRGSRTVIDPLLRREIDRILKNEQGRWVMFSYDRLRQFGYRFDSF